MEPLEDGRIDIFWRDLVGRAEAHEPRQTESELRVGEAGGQDFPGEGQGLTGAPRHGPDAGADDGRQGERPDVGPAAPAHAGGGMRDPVQALA